MAALSRRSPSKYQAAGHQTICASCLLIPAFFDQERIITLDRPNCEIGRDHRSEWIYITKRFQLRKGSQFRSGWRAIQRNQWHTGQFGGASGSPAILLAVHAPAQTIVMTRMKGMKRGERKLVTKTTLSKRRRARACA